MDSGRFGFWAAIAALLASVGYGIPQLMQVAGMLADPWDRILIFAPSLALAPAFVLTMAALHTVSPPGRSAFSLGALGLAIMYGTLVSSVYITQLSVVIPHELAGDGSTYAIFACCGQHQFTTGLDLLGYTLMSLSTLCAVPVLPRQLRWTRGWLVANGVLAPFLIGQTVWPALIYVGALWLITFPAAMIALAIFFRHARDAGISLGGGGFEGRLTPEQNG
jgi:hypothetical protein